MDATDTFLSAMHQCEGRSSSMRSGGCHSCGSIILMHANEFTLSENFNMLVHNGSLGGYDDLNKFAAHAKHGVEYMMKVMRRTYEGFLTPEELQAMIDGKDFWMDGKGVHGSLAQSSHGALQGEAEDAEGGRV
jgi:ATP-dependent protease ClpP protease subunit